MDTRTSTVLLLLLASFTSTSVVKWVPNSSFNLPNNFKDGKLPCSKKTIIFPSVMSGSVGIEDAMDVGALILPEDGEIVLENTVIALGTEKGENNCTEGNSYYVDKALASWTQADVWSSPRFTEATPDAEKIPCYNDVVVFPKGAKYTVQLPDNLQYVKEFRIGNQSYSTQSLHDYVQSQSDQMEQFVVNNLFQTGVDVKEKYCQQSFGCPCQQNPPKIDCSVKYCPAPACDDPVKPTGFCCSICGGSVSFEIEESFDLSSFRDLVEKTVNGYDDGVVYHIGFESTKPVNIIQLVIVDKGDYIGSSAQAINSVSKNIYSHWYKGETLTQISGGPLYKKGLGPKIFFSMFFLVFLVMGSVYVYYYRLPAVTFPTGSRRMFSRFQNRSDSVVSLTRRDSGALPPVRTAFRNPLYDSKRGRVQVRELEEEE